MKESYLKYYEKSSARALFRFLWDAFSTSSKRRKTSLFNRQRDYLGLTSDPKLLALHKRLNEVLLRATREWDSYDYGEGYFYQSCSPLGLTG